MLLLMVIQSHFTGYNLKKCSRETINVYISIFGRQGKTKTGSTNLNSNEDEKIRFMEKREEARKRYIEQRSLEQAKEEIKAGPDLEKLSSLTMQPLPNFEMPPHFEQTMQDMEQLLDSWESKLIEAENLTLGSPEMVAALEQLQDVSSISLPVPLDVEKVAVPWYKCPQISSEPLPYLTRSELEQFSNEMNSVVQSTKDIISDDQYKHKIQEWVMKEISNLDGIAPEEISEDDIRSQITTYMDMKERRVDYASLRMGASVVYSETSPSLKDTLPLFNRFMQSVKLRFYGYGPEAALSITSPPWALGQCWSFQQHSSSTHGKMATLTIQLEKLISVKSVVIQHPSRELASDFETAIRDFRILGSGEDDGLFELGTFLYDVDSIWSNQEFEVSQKDIPKLRKIILAIDSNWGANYSCLYRFLIHENLLF